MSSWDDQGKSFYHLVIQPMISPRHALRFAAAKSESLPIWGKCDWTTCESVQNAITATIQVNNGGVSRVIRIVYSLFGFENNHAWSRWPPLRRELGKCLLVYRRPVRRMDTKGLPAWKSFRVLRFFGQSCRMFAWVLFPDGLFRCRWSVGRLQWANQWVG